MEQVDFLIIGAGLAGIVTKRFLNNESTVIVDRDPGGYKIGESIIPEHFHHPLVAQLLPAMQELPSYSPKYGTTFIADGNVASFPLPAREVGVAMHVDRWEMERRMMELWETPVRRERVVSIDFDRKSVQTDRSEYLVAKQIIDCSGPAMVVASLRNDVRELWPVFATWAYFDVEANEPKRFHEAVRERGWSYLRYDARHRRILEAEELEGWLPSRSTLLTKIRDGVWTWQIPLHNESRVSFGMVSRHGKVSQEELLEVAREQAGPNYTLRLRPLDQSSDHNRLHVRNGFARTASTAATQDYILLSDAFCFADPIYSVGTGLAVNKAIEVAHLLNEGDWNSETRRAYCDSYGRLVERAIAGFQYWYSGELLESDAAAAEVQDNLLVGNAFQAQISLHYGNVIADADLSERILRPDPFTVNWSRPALTDEVRGLLGLGEGQPICGWTLLAAHPAAGGVQSRWKHPDLPELTLLVYPKEDDTLSLSHMTIHDRPYPQGRELTSLMDSLSGHLARNLDEWYRLVRTAILV